MPKNYIKPNENKSDQIYNNKRKLSNLSAHNIYRNIKVCYSCYIFYSLINHILKNIESTFIEGNYFQILFL